MLSVVRDSCFPNPPLLSYCLAMKRVHLLHTIVHVVVLLSLLTACALPQVSAEERMFLDLSLNFLPDSYFSPQTRLSDITYQLQGYGSSNASGTFYGISEAVSSTHPAQLYTLQFEFDTIDPNSQVLENVTVKAVKTLENQTHHPLNSETLYPESLAFTPRDSIFIAAEEIQGDETLPLVGEFNLKTGELKNTVPLPPGYRPAPDQATVQQGIQPQLGLKAMTISPNGLSLGGLDPFRLFMATEAPLFQDLDPEQPTAIRMLHYLIADQASFLVSENLYPLEATPETEAPYRLAEIVALPESGNFLSLERSQTPTGYKAKIYQVFTGNATDTSRIASLRGQPSTVQPLRKKLLLDLTDLNIPLQRLDAMTLGPRFPNKSQSLILMSHDTEDTTLPTQFLLFNLKRAS